MGDGDYKGRSGLKTRFEGPKISLDSDAKARGSLYGPGYGGYGYGMGYGYADARADSDIVIDGGYFETIIDGEGKRRDAIKAALDSKNSADSEASVDSETGLDIEIDGSGKSKGGYKTSYVGPEISVGSGANAGLYGGLGGYGSARADADSDITIGGGKFITEYVGDYKDGRDVKLALDSKNSAEAAAALDSESNLAVDIDGDYKDGRDV